MKKQIIRVKMISRNLLKERYKGENPNKIVKSIIEENSKFKIWGNNIVSLNKTLKERFSNEFRTYVFQNLFSYIYEKKEIPLGIIVGNSIDYVYQQYLKGDSNSEIIAIYENVKYSEEVDSIYKGLTYGIPLKDFDLGEYKDIQIVGKYSEITKKEKWYQNLQWNIGDKNE